jgi:hypothetical protein
LQFIARCGGAVPLTLSDADILAKLTVVEDGTTERKPYADTRGWTKTVVAFSNSLNEDQPGVLFVGVNNNGTIQEPQANFEDLQKKLSGELGNIYPPVYPTILVREKDGKKFVAVVVYGSPGRPHFAGRSYLRDGTQTVEASEPQIKEFIDKRSGKVAELLKWKGKSVTVQRLNPEHVVLHSGRVASSTMLILHDCNNHWLTLQQIGGPSNLSSIALRQVELNYDHSERCLMLEVYPA